MRRPFFSGKLVFYYMEIDVFFVVFVILSRRVRKFMRFLKYHFLSTNKKSAFLDADGERRMQSTAT